MKKLIFIGLATVIVAALPIIGITRKQSPIIKPINEQVERNHGGVIEQTERLNSVPSDWKIYINDRLGITFQYPKTWIKGKESNVINRKGEIMAILVNFNDTISQSSFFIEYHLAPYGAELYKYVKAEFDSSQGLNAADVKEIEVAGNKAIESTTTLSKNIKGGVFDPPLRMIHIVFLDKQKTGAFELHFKTPLPGEDTEITKLKRLLSTFKFTN